MAGANAALLRLMSSRTVQPSNPAYLMWAPNLNIAICVRFFDFQLQSMNLGVIIGVCQQGGELVSPTDPKAAMTGVIDVDCGAPPRGR